MKRILLVIAVTGILFSIGCSCVSQIEREQFIKPQARQEYVKAHPDSRFNENISNGEITRGMSGHEVMASWGLPNVYMTSDKRPEEYWVYYVLDQKEGTLLIYTLKFDDVSTLRDWDIDMKRYVDVSSICNPSCLREKATEINRGKR